ncbi:hypothetical protein ACWEQG_38985, partial [Microbispora sp. NPDC004025]
RAGGGARGRGRRQRGDRAEYAESAGDQHPAGRAGQAPSRAGGYWADAYWAGGYCTGGYWAGR